MTQSWTLPVPPSANHLWEGMGRRRHRTRRYEAWLLECLYRMGPVRQCAGPAAIRIVIRGGIGFDGRRDIDNAIKPIVDLVKHKRVIRDDNITWVTSVLARYEPPADEQAEAVLLLEVEDLASQRTARQSRRKRRR